MSFLPDIETALNLLSGFTTSEWADWIEGFLNQTPIAPHISRGFDSAHLALNAIYDQLPDSGRTAFAAGLADLIPAAQPTLIADNTEKIFSLLQVAAHVVPRAAKAILLSRLTSGSLRGICFAGWDLHSLLLVVCSQYGVDEKLSTYILHSVEEIRDFDYVVICFRMLIKRGPEMSPCLLLGQLLPQLNDTDKVDRVADIVEEHLFRNGASHLLDWFEEIAPQLSARGVPGMDNFEEAVRRAIPWPDNPDKVDPTTLLLAAYVHSTRRRFTAKDIGSLFNVQYRSVDGKLEERLKRILDRVAAGAPGWDYVDGTDESALNYLQGTGPFIRIIDKAPGAWDETTIPRSELNKKITNHLKNRPGRVARLKHSHGGLHTSRLGRHCV